MTTEKPGSTSGAFEEHSWTNPGPVAELSCLRQWWSLTSTSCPSTCPGFTLQPWQERRASPSATEQQLKHWFASKQMTNHPTCAHRHTRVQPHTHTGMQRKCSLSGEKHGDPTLQLLGLWWATIVAMRTSTRRQAHTLLHARMHAHNRCGIRDSSEPELLSRSFRT